MSRKLSFIIHSVHKQVFILNEGRKAYYLSLMHYMLLMPEKEKHRLMIYENLLKNLCID
jgi:PHD/YefM family antitoxin component YafN of YafNO toxin-antitoxin module